MSSPEYVKWLLLNPDKIDYIKERYPFMARFIVKYVKEKYPQWFSSIENYECYFCGTRFDSPYKLRLHLSKTKCSSPFENMVRSIILEWDKFEIICGKSKFRRKNDARQMLLQLLDNDSVKLEDIYLFCRENS